MDRRGFLGAAVMAAVAVLAGCTPSAGGEDPPSGSPSALEPTTLVTLPPGAWWVDVPGLDAKFAIYDSWENYDPAKLLEMTEGELPGDIREKAASMGMSGARMLDAFAAAAKVVSIDPYTKASLYLSIAEGTAVPEPAALMKSVTDLGGTAGDPAVATTPLAEGTQVPYTLTFGAATSHGQVIAVPVDGQVLMFTISAKDRAVVDSATELVVATISRRDR